MHRECRANGKENDWLHLARAMPNWSQNSWEPCLKRLKLSSSRFQSLPNFVDKEADLAWMSCMAFKAMRAATAKAKDKI